MWDIEGINILAPKLSVLVCSVMPQGIMWTQI